MGRVESVSGPDHPDHDRRTIAVALWRMSRPAQLALILLVYGFGVAMGVAHSDTSDFGGVLTGAAVLLPVAASVHYANEYADVQTDALTDRTPFSGGSGALVETGLSPRLAARAAAVAGGLGVVATLLWVSAVGGRTLAPTPVALLFGVLILGLQYSVGPLRLAWNGLGGVTNALLGGVALPLYGFAVVTGTVTAEAALATVPFALVVFVNLLETTWPDRHADAAVGKRTLATRVAPRTLRIAYVAASLAAGGTAIALAGSTLPRAVVIGTLVPLVGLAVGAYRFTHRETPYPAVVSMVLVAVGSTAGWILVALGDPPTPIA